MRAWPFANEKEHHGTAFESRKSATVAGQKPAPAGMDEADFGMVMLLGVLLDSHSTQPRRGVKVTYGLVIYFNPN